MSKEATKTSVPVAAKGIAVPSKYRRLGNVANAPYFNLAQGNSFEGKLLGVYERVNERAKTDEKAPKMVKFFQLELLAVAEVKEGKGEAATIKQAEPGTIINLNCCTKTADLIPCALEIKHGAEYNVFVHCGKKMALANKNTMWDITVAVEQVKAPLIAVSAGEPDFDDDDQD
jgi:hypothetical protein